MFATCLQTLLRSQRDFVNEVDHWKLTEAKGAVLSALARWFLPGNHRQEDKISTDQQPSGSAKPREEVGTRGPRLDKAPASKQ